MAARGAPVARVVGLDLARAVAMAGMLVVHTLDDAPATAPDRALMWANVWTAPLFVLVAGAGLSLAWDHRQVTRVRALVTGRAVILLGIGLWLGTQFYGPILHYFALYFVLGLLALGLGRRALVALSAAFLVGGPLALTYLVHAGTITLDGGGDVGFEALTHPVGLLRALAVDGIYPAIVWSGFFFAGMAIGRIDLEDRRVAARLAVAGAAVGATGSFVSWIGARTFGSQRFSWDHHWTGAAHSESLLWALTAAGIAVAITGACLWIATRTTGRGPLLAPIVALGQVALTFYLLHLWYADTLWISIEPHVTSTPAYLAATVAFYALFAGGAWLWRRFFRHGPVEAVSDAAVRAVVRPRPAPQRQDSART